MGLGVISCQVFEREMAELLPGFPDVDRVKVLEWGLHINPDHLLNRIESEIKEMAGRVSAVVLAYGRCQALDRLPDDLGAPVFRPRGDDCIGVLLGQERYERELLSHPGTWFLTPGWTHLGMEFIFRELQLDKLAAKWSGRPHPAQTDPLALAHRMLKDYTRALLINPGAGDELELAEKAGEIAREFGWTLDTVRVDLSPLEKCLQDAKRYAQSQG